MKKRIFIPVSFGFIFLVLFFFALAVLGSISCVYGFLGLLEGIDVFYVPFILLGVIFVFYTAIRLLCAFKIHLRQEDIATFGDGLPKIEKIQYKTFIKYSDIKNIAIIASEKDSRDKKIQAKWVSSSIPKKYLEFTLINEQKRRMCIHYYTRWQIKKMLAYISHNMKVMGNTNLLKIDEIMLDWYAYDGYNRDDLKLKRGERLSRKKEQILKEKGFFELSNELQIKFIRLYNAKLKSKYSDYITIKDFSEVINKVSVKYFLGYNNKVYYIEKKENQILVYEVGEEMKLLNIFDSSENICEELKLGDKDLKSIWNDIIKSKEMS